MPAGPGLPKKAVPAGGTTYAQELMIKRIKATTIGIPTIATINGTTSVPIKAPPSAATPAPTVATPALILPPVIPPAAAAPPTPPTIAPGIPKGINNNIPPAAAKTGTINLLIKGPILETNSVPVFAAAGGILLFIPFGIPGAIVGGVGGAAAAGGITGGSISAGVATVGAGVAALGGAFIGTLVVPFIVAIVGIPIVVAFILFIINSGAYLVQPCGSPFLGSPW